MDSYYEHFNDFGDIHITNETMPSDVKRVISYGKHSFNTRDYFYSPSEQQVYTYSPVYDEYVMIKRYVKGKSLLFYLRTDDKKTTSMTVNDNFIRRTQTMNRIEF